MVARLLIAGDQLPVNPFSEVVGNPAKFDPEQIGATAANVGVIFGLTAIAKVVVVAHCPVAGVKVYVVVAILFNAGVHVPEKPLLEVFGNGVMAAPIQTGATAAKIGTIFGLMLIVKGAVVAHCPAAGVKV